MGSKKPKKRRGTGKASSHKQRNFPTLFLIIVCAGVATVGGLLLYSKHATESDRKTANPAPDFSNQSSALNVTPDKLRKLVGRWFRPDGGYVIDIRNVDADGKLQAAYFNPRPIRVSQALVIKAEERPQIFIELIDVGYPGATYTLTYNAQHDVLAGLYFQPAVDQTFDVVFVRMQ